MGKTNATIIQRLAWLCAILSPVLIVVLVAQGKVLSAVLLGVCQGSFVVSQLSSQPRKERVR